MIPRFAKSSLLSIMLLCAPRGEAMPEPAGPQHMTRQQLVGAWRLVSIELTGPQGRLADPFYQPESMGIIIYDAAGWMSVQISAPHRTAWEVPASRSAAAVMQNARLKAQAFDTYYSYYGTWDYDEAKSAVTHHVKSSVVPAESGLDYTQTVTLVGGRLTFSVRGKSHGEDTVRKKVWERITTSVQ
jgi:hypothetical protein